MTARAKFLFDLDFSAPGREREAEPRITAEAHAAAVTEAEARGYRSGLASAEAQARAEAERRTALAIERVAAALDRLLAATGALERRLEIEAVEVAHAVARKLAPELVAREPMAEIAALAKGCLAELRSAPHLAVRVNETLHEVTRDCLAGVARATGFEGRLVVLGESDIAPGDCRIEWADGGVVRDLATVDAAISDAVGRYIAARREPAPAHLSGDQ